MSNLVDHARRELELIGEEPETIDWYCKVIAAFTSYGHSGGSASIAIPTINKLLQFKNLKPLTDDPNEWMNVSVQSGLNVSDQSGYEMWQNRRNPEAFSDDGGKTYWLLSEGGSAKNRTPRHDSEPKNT